MPVAKEDWIRKSEPLMRYIRSGNNQFVSNYGTLATDLVYIYNNANTEAWGPLSGQRVKRIVKWLKPDINLSVNS